MKEIEKKDLPGISGGQVSPTAVIAPGGPIAPMPYPQTPAGPIGPTDPYDPLGDGTHHKQV
ncbi:MAG TPA: hypothetical protein VN598_02810 [Usitatibacter sp.]|nr:hypothetical protein [Usitatibacter sp.]